MDAPVRRLTIAEEAERAAQIAFATNEHQRNPYEADTDAHREFEASYTRWFCAFAAPEGEASA